MTCNRYLPFGNPKTVQRFKCQDGFHNSSKLRHLLLAVESHELARHGTRRPLHKRPAIAQSQRGAPRRKAASCTGMLRETVPRPGVHRGSSLFRRRRMKKRGRCVPRFPGGDGGKSSGPRNDSVFQPIILAVVTAIQSIPPARCGMYPPICSQQSRRNSWHCPDTCLCPSKLSVSEL